MTRLLLRGFLLAARPRRHWPPRPSPATKGWSPLFDGKSFAGWKKVGGGATYTIEGDTIVGKVGPGNATASCGPRRPTATSSSRSTSSSTYPPIRASSSAAISSPRPTATAASTATSARSTPCRAPGRADSTKKGGGPGSSPSTDTPRRKGLQARRLEPFTIMACGPHLRTWLNGVPCADLIDGMDLEGFIALQVHAGKAGQIRFKNIRLKDLGQSVRKPLWDGTTLAGWSTQGAATGASRTA